MNLHLLSTTSPAACGFESTQSGAARRVKFARLPSWLADGVAVAKLHPLWWLAALLVCADFATLLELVPRFAVLAPLAVPFAAGLLVLMQERASRARPWSAGEALAAVQSHRNALAAIGLGACALMGLGYLVQVAAFHLSVTPVGVQGDLRGIWIVFNAHREAWAGFEPLVAVPFYALGVAALWFAPALVVLRGLPALDAMLTSLRAVLRNWRVALVYAVAIAADLLLAPVVPMLVRGLVVTPLATALIVLSMYGSYREVFGER
jgi:uncharacterized membrane protein